VAIHAAGCKCLFCVDAFGIERRDRGERNEFGVCPLCTSPLSEVLHTGYRICTAEINPACHYAVECPDDQAPKRGKHSLSDAMMTDAEWDHEPDNWSKVFRNEELWLPSRFWDAEEFYSYYEEHCSFKHFLIATSHLVPLVLPIDEDDW
jgi:hypothetical protein